MKDAVGGPEADADRALLELLRGVRDADYRFVTITPDPWPWVG